KNYSAQLPTLLTSSDPSTATLARSTSLSDVPSPSRCFIPALPRGLRTNRPRRPLSAEFGIALAFAWARTHVSSRNLGNAQENHADGAVLPGLPDSVRGPAGYARPGSAGPYDRRRPVVRAGRGRDVRGHDLRGTDLARCDPLPGVLQAGFCQRGEPGADGDG